jgi:hypothetical protein
LIVSGSVSFFVPGDIGVRSCDVGAFHFLALRSAKKLETVSAKSILCALPALVAYYSASFPIEKKKNDPIKEIDFKK